MANALVKQPGQVPHFLHGRDYLDALTSPAASPNFMLKLHTDLFAGLPANCFSD